MNKAILILTQVKRAIGQNLDEKAYSIMKSNATYLSKRDMSNIIKYMRRTRARRGAPIKRKYMHRVMQYIFYESPYEFDPSYNNNIPIRGACCFGYYDTAKMLLADTRVDPSANMNEAIQMACKNGHIEIVRLLLADKRVDPAATENFAIRLASRNGYSDIVRLLLEDGKTDPSAYGSIVMLEACKAGYPSIVRILLEDGRADPSISNNRCLVLASQYGHLGVVQLLLTEQRVMDSNLLGALSEAYIFGYTNIARLITATIQNEKNADVL